MAHPADRRRPALILIASMGCMIGVLILVGYYATNLTPLQLQALRLVFASLFAWLAWYAPGTLVAGIQLNTGLKAAGALAMFAFGYFTFGVFAHSALPLSSPPERTSLATVRVLFATDRALAGGKGVQRNTYYRLTTTFGAMRGAEITYGYCDVSIPRDHRMGELEGPSILRLEFRETPEKHVVLLGGEILGKDEFFSAVRQRIGRAPRSTAFVFVHGYNVSFEDAARRTAQMAYDLAFDGAPVFYSWPSDGSTAAYTIDEQAIEWAQTNLRRFLEDFLHASDAVNVYLIAHSMGSRALTRAVASLMTERPDLKGRISEVILAAPDIDTAVFKRDIAPLLTRTGRPVTLYASSDDLALSASQRVHRYPRAGESGRGLVVTSGIETIDATGVDTSFLGHSYFAERKSVLSDIFYIVHQGQRASNRFGLREERSADGRYWRFKR